MDKSVAHKGGMNHFGTQAHPDGLVPWREAEAPDMSNARKTTGRLRGCGYCGSMHPTDLAAAIKGGAKGSFADQKYGWPHKAYFDDVPNPHAGMLESRSSTSRPTPEELESGKYIPVPGDFVVVDQQTGRSERKMEYYAAPTPAGSKTYGKFYSVHLLDATPEEKDIIERHLGLRFTFTDDGKVGWRPLAPGE
jgi:hypothetical protein